MDKYRILYLDGRTHSDCILGQTWSDIEAESFNQALDKLGIKRTQVLDVKQWVCSGKPGTSGIGIGGGWGKFRK